MRFVSICIAAAVLLPVPVAAEDVTQETLHNAIAKALVLLEDTSPTFIKKGGCNSCHNQMLASAAQAFARSRGVRIGETIAQLPPEVSEASTERYVEYSIAGGGGINALGYDFLSHVLANRPADARMRAQVHFIKGMQEPAGYWSGGAGRRPPLAFDDFTPTALMVLAIDRYSAPADARDTAARIARARSWLLAAKPDRTQEHAFKVLGLAWAGADRATIQTGVSGLRALQTANGGWSQLPGLATDAYATGLALYAMHVGGVPSNDSAYQSGLKYLLSTQAADGTWHVRSRAIPFQPYFESGYPYGHDQWISAAGASYATLALAAAVEPSRSSQ
jgi:hypothetical protein